MYVCVTNSRHQRILLIRGTRWPSICLTHSLTHRHTSTRTRTHTHIHIGKHLHADNMLHVGVMSDSACPSVWKQLSLAKSRVSYDSTFPNCPLLQDAWDLLPYWSCSTCPPSQTQTGALWRPTSNHIIPQNGQTCALILRGNSGRVWVHRWMTKQGKRN